MFWLTMYAIMEATTIRGTPPNILLKDSWSSQNIGYGKIPAIYINKIKRMLHPKPPQTITPAYFFPYNSDIVSVSKKVS